MSEERRKQQRQALLLGGTALGIILVTVGLLMNRTPTGLPASPAYQGVDESIINDRTSAASPEMSWITQSRQRIDEMSKQVEELTKAVKGSHEEFNARLNEMDVRYEEAILNQQAAINALQSPGAVSAGQGMQEGPLTDPAQAGYGSEFISGSGDRTDVTGQRQGTAPALPPSLQGSFSTNFPLAPKAELQPASAGSGDARDPQLGLDRGKLQRIHDLDSYIPAGSYAPAVVLSGVDASTGVSRDNPIPVLLRVTGPAVTAGPQSTNGRRINLTGCTVMGSAMGDLSAERVYVRLTTMTCIDHKDRIFETEIAGLVVGSGKAGVRGEVVSREGNLVTSAAIAGTLQGLSGAMSAAANAAAGADGASAGAILNNAGTAAAGGGIGSAAETLADYYIKRAEQYQPVVSLYGGTEVEVVFMEGIALK